MWESCPSLLCYLPCSPRSASETAGQTGLPAVLQHTHFGFQVFAHIVRSLWKPVCSPHCLPCPACPNPTGPDTTSSQSSPASLPPSQPGLLSLPFELSLHQERPGPHLQGRRDIHLPEGLGRRSGTAEGEQSAPPCQPKPATPDFLVRIRVCALLSLLDAASGKTNSCPPPTCLHCLVCRWLSGSSRLMRPAWHFSAYLGCAPSASPPSSARGSKHIAKAAKPFRPFFFLNKQEDHKVCLHGRPAKHETPAVHGSGPGSCNERGPMSTVELLPGARSFACALPLSLAQGWAGARGEGSDLAAPCRPASSSSGGQSSHN